MILSAPLLSDVDKEAADTADDDADADPCCEEEERVCLEKGLGLLRAIDLAATGALSFFLLLLLMGASIVFELDLGRVDNRLFKDAADAGGGGSEGDGEEAGDVEVLDCVESMEVLYMSVSLSSCASRRLTLAAWETL